MALYLPSRSSGTLTMRPRQRRPMQTGAFPSMSTRARIRFAGSINAARKAVEVSSHNDQSMRLDQFYETTIVTFSIELIGGDEPIADAQIVGNTQLASGKYTISHIRSWWPGEPVIDHQSGQRRFARDQSVEKAVPDESDYPCP